MAKQDVTDRLTELGIYSDYYYRLEIKTLGNILNPDETLLCVLTGVFEGSRRMLAITDYRLIIIAASAIAGGNVKIIKRKAVKSWNFTKKFLLSSASIETENETFTFKQTQAARKELFEKAMNSTIKEFDE